MVSKEVVRAFENVENLRTKANWALASFEGDKIILYGEGSGGYDEMTSKFDPKMYLFGILEVHALDRLSTVESKRSKTVFITSIGSKTSNVVVTMALRNRGSLDQLRKRCPISFNTSENLKNFSRHHIAKALLGICGAHQPKFFSFNDGSELDVKDIKIQDESDDDEWGKE